MKNRIFKVDSFQFGDGAISGYITVLKIWIG